ncbi:suppressor of fused domain protein [Paenibacillus lentus]|uniref:Suppressor of fused domain protein n=1 Tax=Paenibacillus lentus TaxID=1338368 RepID=A0A3S8RPT1_9BACL|nr:suppressor of fused domain protein [Paenibacillus lentus]AZK44859.1 suppressor of fused domain protein [Paenibacillus lentus]
MKTSAELYIGKLEELFGEEDVIKKIDPSDGSSPVHVFFYYDLPEEGMLTVVTYGLSEGEFDEWKSAKPELILSLETQDESWGLAVAYFAAEFRGLKGFSYGDIFTLDTPIAKESEMTGFFTFATSILEKDDTSIKLPDKTIQLVGMYPIYKEEVDLLKRIGIKEFWHKEEYNIYSTNRPNLARL